MKLTIDEFKSTILPGLRAQHKTAEALEKAIQATIDGSEIVDADGNPVMIAEINLTSEPAEEPEETPEETPAETPPAEGASLSADDIAKAVASSVAKALAEHGKNQPPPAGNPVIKFKPAEPERTRIETIPHRHTKAFRTYKSEAKPAHERAYRFGRWCAALMGHPKSLAWCSDNGVALVHEKAQTEGLPWDGGYLVPDEFDADLIDLREQYGVFRRNARNVPMASETKDRNRRSGGLTAHFVGELASGTESTKTWDQVKLVAKKLMAVTTASSEINEDGMINLGDDLAGEIAYAFANKEDDCGFNGDGTDTYGGIVGVRAQLKGLDATIANIAGLVVASGNAYSEIVLGDLTAVAGLLPTFGDTPNAKWYIHRQVWLTYLKDLVIDAGGNTVVELQAKLPDTLLGYPVEPTQIMPKAEANSQVVALFGDLRLAADFGDRRGTTIEFSREATIGSVNMFESDGVAIKGTERFDINVHDAGNATATAADKTPGPIVGLIMAAS